MEGGKAISKNEKDTTSISYADKGKGNALVLLPPSYFSAFESSVPISSTVQLPNYRLVGNKQGSMPCKNIEDILEQCRPEKQNFSESQNSSPFTRNLMANPPCETPQGVVMGLNSILKAAKVNSSSASRESCIKRCNNRRDESEALVREEGDQELIVATSAIKVGSPNTEEVNQETLDLGTSQKISKSAKKRMKKNAKLKAHLDDVTPVVETAVTEPILLHSLSCGSLPKLQVQHQEQTQVQELVLHEVIASTPNFLQGIESPLHQPQNLAKCLHKSRSRSELLPPIGIFWDIENCQVPRYKSAMDLVTVLRKKWESEYREVEFFVACDITKEDACVLQDLHHANVTVAHVFAVSKNAADEKLRQLMRKFAETYTAPCAAALISSDINFAGDLHALKRLGVRVILYHNEMVSKALQASAHSTFGFPDLLKCVPCKSTAMSQTGDVDLFGKSRAQVVVSNLPEKKLQLIKSRLNQLSDNCGGKFVRKIGEHAVMDFASPCAAARASKRLEGEDVFGSKIRCSKPYVSEVRRPPVGRVSAPPRLLGSPYRCRSGPFPPPPNPFNVEPPKLRLVKPFSSSFPQQKQPFHDAFNEATSSVDRPDYYRTPSEYLVETTPEGYRRIKGIHKVIVPEKKAWSVSGCTPLEKDNSCVNLTTRERNTADGHSSSSSSCSSTSPPPNPVDLHVTNLDSSLESRQMKKLLKSTFSEHVTVLHVGVQMQSDGSLTATVRVPSLQDAQCAVSVLHRKKLGFKRMMIAYSSPRSPTPQQLRSQVVSLLLEVPQHRLPLFKFREMYEKRFHLSVGIAELHRLRDTVVIAEDLSGRNIQLAPHYYANQGYEMGNAGLEDIRCELHAPSHVGLDQGWAETEEEVELPSVLVTLKDLAMHIKNLLHSHGGSLPLNTLAYCYAAEIGPLNVRDDGVPLEHLVSCVAGIEIVVMPSGAKKLQWASTSPDMKSEELRSVSPALAPQIWLFCRELVDLLKVAPQGRIAFSRFIPAYHHHFGRQCRVADYGYTRLADLMEALPSVVQVLGQGTKRMIMLAHRAQVKRFTSDLLRILKAQTSKQISISTFSIVYEKVLGKAFDSKTYGVCDVTDLVAEVSEIIVVENLENDEDVILALPKREQTPQEKERTKTFAVETVELLRHAPQCKMAFSKFIPSYHHHFGRQCRVADYGFTKLIELFEAVPEIVQITDSEGENDKFIQLTLKERLKVLTSQIEHLVNLQKRPYLPLYTLPEIFCKQFGFVLRPQQYGVQSLEDLINLVRNSFLLIMDQPYPLLTLVDKSVLATKKRQIRRILYATSDGSMPLEELQRTFVQTYHQPCPDLEINFGDLLLLEDQEGVMMVKLTPLQICGRNLYLLLQEHGGQMPLNDLETCYGDRFGTVDGLAHMGCANLTHAMELFTDIMMLKGKGQRRFVTLIKDERSFIPLMSRSPHPAQVMELKPPAHWLVPENSSSLRSESPSQAPIVDERIVTQGSTSFYATPSVSIKSLLLGPLPRSQVMYAPMTAPYSPWVWGFGFGGIPYRSPSSNYAYNYMVSTVPWWPPCSPVPCMHAATVQEIEDEQRVPNTFPPPPAMSSEDDRERKEDKRRPRLAAQFDSSN